MTGRLRQRCELSRSVGRGPLIVVTDWTRPDGWEIARHVFTDAAADEPALTIALG